ncbi:PilZ domain-containing protein [candidate division FCPU426 bacterium]|nr:PilZ domain-containing protein [candidate division FCPU426 bacterium]
MLEVDMHAETGKAETIVERRKYPRLPLKLAVNYLISDQASTRSFFSQSITRDLGIGGMALVVEEKIETGQMITVQIGLPEPETAFIWAVSRQPMHISRTVTLTSRVIWRQPYEEKKYIIGVQFLDLELLDAQNLKKFLEDFKLQEGKWEEEQE